MRGNADIPTKEDVGLRGRHSNHPCKKCGKLEVYVTENDQGDAYIKCFGCLHGYWVDGPDA